MKNYFFWCRKLLFCLFLLFFIIPANAQEERSPQKLRHQNKTGTHHHKEKRSNPVHERQTSNHYDHGNKEETRVLNETLHSREMTAENRKFINGFWVLLAAALVFLMQAGFTSFEVGLVQEQHKNGVGIKNITDWLIVSIVFYLFGFGFMFGISNNALIGSSHFLHLYQHHVEHYEFVIFQLAFATTAVTIISGALAERTNLAHYLIISVVVGGFIYPIFGHWVWGDLYFRYIYDQYLPSNQATFPKETLENILNHQKPWLASLGFHDFAGATVVHSIGAWIALVGIWFVGPRYNRFSQRKVALRSHNLGYSVLGVFLLWFGWWGFNGGSTLHYDDDVTKIILNTNLSGAAAGVSAFLMAYFIYLKKHRKNSLMEDDIAQEEVFAKLLGGALGGLVAITACCDMVEMYEAIIIGACAGLIHNLAFDLLIKLKLDDPVGAIPVHGVCGVWGTLCVGLFGDFSKLPVQLLGIAVAFAFASSLGFILFSILYRLGLRVTVTKEVHGHIL